MMSFRKSVLFSAMALALAATPVAAAGGVKVGKLTCDAVGGTNFLVGSSKALDCRFTSSEGRTEYYRATIKRFGLDLGKIRQMTIVWGVVAPTKTLRPGSLAGSYGGLSADVSIGAGAGANALVGGLNKSITLQPLSFQSQTGTNIAAGVASMTLRAR